MSEQQKSWGERSVLMFELATRQAQALERLADAAEQALPLLAGLVEILAEADALDDDADDSDGATYLDGTPKD